MPTADDLNRYAAAADDYDGMTVHVDNPDLDAGVTVAGGGAKVAITMLGAGNPGTEPGRYPATDGRNYSTPAVFTLTDPGGAQWLGLWVGTEYARSAKLRHPVGPGTESLVAAVNVRNAQ